MFHDLIHTKQAIYATSASALRTLTCAAALLFGLKAGAQGISINDGNIRSLQLMVNDEWGEPPVMLLDGNDYIAVSYDDMQANYVRRYYKLVHCNADWTPSDLLESEYIDGFNDNVIDEYEPSMNTMAEYNHYEFAIPNDEVSLKVGGNYRLEIWDEDAESPAATVCFSVVEPRVGINAELSGNTDTDTNGAHQQISFTISYSGYDVKDPVSDMKVVVMQNGRTDNIVTGVKPTYLRNNELIYVHNHSLIFEAGNEFRRFEILDEKVPTMNVERMAYAAPFYHATLYADEPRTNYIFDRDQDGLYYIRNNDDVDNETESDYFMTHFTLNMPQLPGGDVYVCGSLTENRFSDKSRMTYNPLTHCYETVLPLKQGSYNYQYLFVRDGETVGHSTQTEGNFYQTENEYWIYVYHRPFGERSDKLVGFQKIKNEVR